MQKMRIMLHSMRQAMGAGRGWSTGKSEATGFATKAAGIAQTARTRESASGERGSITVTQTLILVTLVSLTVMLVGYAQVATQRNRVQAIADLTSLSAAQRAFYYPGSDSNGCQLAREVAQANQATLVSCQPGRNRVVVTVSLPALAIGKTWQVKATAKAGPLFQ